MISFNFFSNFPAVSFSNISEKKFFLCSYCTNIFAMSVSFYTVIFKNVVFARFSSILFASNCVNQTLILECPCACARAISRESTRVQGYKNHNFSLNGARHMFWLWGLALMAFMPRGFVWFSGNSRVDDAKHSGCKICLGLLFCIFAIRYVKQSKISPYNSPVRCLILFSQS